jgi:hypothetical protein
LAFLAHALKEEFLKPTHFEIVVAGSDPVALVERVLDWRPPAVAKWISTIES